MLLVLLVARAALAFMPSMVGWSLNVQRFLAPAIGWGAWLLAAAALAPALANRALPALEWMGEAMRRRPGMAMAAWAIAAAVLVWLAPDRVRFVGDFLLRQGTVEVREQPGLLYPQALPLDVFLHYTLPSALSGAGLVDANGASRLLGALEAAALGALAVAFARALELRGPAAVAAVAVLLFGGYLGMFTGFSKAFAEMCVLVAAAGVFGLQALRRGGGLLGLGVVVAVGLALHRSALGLLPALMLVWVLWWRRHGRGGAWRRPLTLAALAVPLVALAVMLPRIIAVMRRWDSIHFTPGGSEAGLGGAIAGAFAGSRPIDLVNLLLLLSPLVVALPVLGLGRRGGAAPEERTLLLALALPFLAVMPFIHPAQGLFRDWDDFAATGVALSLLVGWAVGRTLEAAPRHAWVAVAVTLGVAAPAVQWLAHHVDVDRGLARVEAFIHEPPPRTEDELGNTWDYLGIRNFRLERWDAAARAFARAVEHAPSPRILQEWALAQTMSGNLHGAMAAYHRMLEKDPRNALGWLGLTSVAARLGDYVEARRAANELLRLQPGNADALRFLTDIDQLERARRAPP